MSDIAGIAPLTPVQGGMLFHTLREPTSDAYIVQYTCRLGGALDPSRLRDAWAGTVARHPALRAAFLFEGLDEPLQVIRAQCKLPWSEVDWSDQADPQSGLNPFLEDDRIRGFDLDRAPLLRVTLIKLDEDDHQMVWTYHHAIADGWSSVLVLDEVWSRYRYPTTSYDNANGFENFATWLAQQPTDAAEDYWRKALEGAVLPTTIAVRRPPAPQIGHGRLTTTLTTAETQQLRAFARDHRLTLNTLVHGAWSVVLSGYSGRSDVVYGATLAGRPSAFPDVETTVGPFINTLPVRARIRAGMPLGEWLQEVQRALLELRDHELSALQDVAEWTDVQASDLFDTLLVFESAPPSDRAVEPDEVVPAVTDEQYFDQSSYPVAVLVHPKEGLELHIVFRRDSLDEASAGRILGEFAELLGAFPDRVDRDISSLVGPGEAQRKALLGPLARGAPTSLSEGGDPRDVLAAILDQMDRNPAHDAIVTPGVSWSYGTLAERVEVVARRLAPIGGPGQRIGILAPKSPEFIAGMLATLAVEAAYVPLDPSNPDPRLRSMIESAGIHTVLTCAVSSERLLALGLDSNAVIRLDHVASEPTDADPWGLRDVLDSDGPGEDSEAYVLFTSGSTGVPKGVRVSRSNLAHSTASRSQVYGDDPPRFLVLSPVGFDSAVAGLVWPLTVGGAVVLVPSDVEQDPRMLGAAIREHAVSTLLCVPALYRLILAGADVDDLAGLRTALVAGEACPATLVDEHIERLPYTALFNEYGPTECTVWSTVARLDRNGAADSPPIGRPIPDAIVRVLDRAGRLTPVGVAGELYIGGPGVALGYLDPTDDGSSFVADPFGQAGQRLYRTGDRVRMSEDGVLEFLGRLDGQIKIRGYRVEPLEIETALTTIPGVSEAVVLKHEARDGGSDLLVAYYTREDGSDLSSDELRAQLNAKLPKYMIPHRFANIADIPRTPRGKIDKRALRQDSREPMTAETRRSESSEGMGATGLSAIGAKLAEVWSSVLGHDGFASDDSFFEVGGDSLLAIRLLGQIREAWDTSLTMAVIFDNPTLAGMADTIETVLWAHETGDTSEADGTFEEMEF